MEFSKLLSNFGSRNGIKDLAPEKGYCCLMFDDIVVNIEENNGNIFFYTPVGELPPEGGEEIYKDLAKANFFFMGTQGATLSADPDSGMILLAYMTPACALNDTSFDKTVENFVNAAEEWSGKIRRRMNQDRGSENASISIDSGLRV